jgi:hypothetical protein
MKPNNNKTNPRENVYEKGNVRLRHRGVNVPNMKVAFGSYGWAWDWTFGDVPTIEPKSKKFGVVASAIRSGRR